MGVIVACVPAVSRVLVFEAAAINIIAITMIPTVLIIMLFIFFLLFLFRLHPIQSNFYANNEKLDVL